MKTIITLAIVSFSLVACSSASNPPAKSAYFTHTHCLNNVECSSGESCFLFEDSPAAPPYKPIRDGLCVRDQ